MQNEQSSSRRKDHTETDTASPKKLVVVAVSGGFDPVHIGHVRLFERAKALGDKLVVILNNDNWLKKKKHHIFMPQHERAEVIAALKAVDEVVVTNHPENADDMTVSDALRQIRPHIFANGGDRPEATHPPKEVAVCKEIGTEMVFNIGDGGKVQSSSWLLERYLESIKSDGTNDVRRS